MNDLNHFLKTLKDISNKIKAKKIEPWYPFNYRGSNTKAFIVTRLEDKAEFYLCFSTEGKLKQRKEIVAHQRKQW